MYLTCELLFPVLFDTYWTYNKIQHDIKTTGKNLKEIERNRAKGDDVVDDLLGILQPGEEEESILDEHVELHMCLGVSYWPHTLLNLGPINLKSTNVMRNKNFHLWRIEIFTQESMI